MSNSINNVTLIGNLTRDPELRDAGGTSVCSLRIAVNDSVKDAQTGEWKERPNFFDVTVWGSTAERCAEYLARGRQVGIDGKLRWREWETDDGGKRQAVDVVARQVQFIGPRDGAQTAPAGQRPPADYDDEIPF